MNVGGEYNRVPRALLLRRLVFLVGCALSAIRDILISLLAMNSSQKVGLSGGARDGPGDNSGRRTGTGNTWMEITVPEITTAGLPPVFRKVEKSGEIPMSSVRHMDIIHL